MKPYFFLVVLASFTSALCSGEGEKKSEDAFFKVCGSFSEFKNLVDKSVTDKEEIGLAIKRIASSPDGKHLTELKLRQMIKEDGLLMCSAFSERPLDQGEFIDRVCSVYTIGPLSWGAKRGWDDNQSIQDPEERATAIGRAVGVSLSSCRKYIGDTYGPQN